MYLYVYMCVCPTTHFTKDNGTLTIDPVFRTVHSPGDVVLRPVDPPPNVQTLDLLSAHLFQLDLHLGNVVSQHDVPPSVHEIS